MSKITIHNMTVELVAARNAQGCIACEVTGPKHSDRADAVYSLIEAALKAEGIEVRLENPSSPVLSILDVTDHSSGEKPDAQKMEEIALKALRIVKRKFDECRSLDAALADVTQQYGSRTAADDNDETPSPGIELIEGDSSLRGYRMGSGKRPERIRRPDDDEPTAKLSLRDRLIKTFRTSVNAVCGITSAYNHLKKNASEELADNVLKLPEAERTEDNILAVAQTGLKEFCATNKITKTGVVDGKRVDTTEGFIRWQAMEAKSAIMDILEAGPNSPGRY